MLDFDTMLLQVGEFGIYQKILFTFQAPFCIFVTFVLFGQVFMVLYPMNYWCDEHFACMAFNSNATSAQRRNISFAWRPPALFQSDACEVNFVDDAFLGGLHDWSQQTCREGPDICRFPNSNNSRNISTLGRTNLPEVPRGRTQSTSGRFPAEKLEENEEGPSRKKRQYGWRGQSYQNPDDRLYNRRTTTTTTTEEPEFGGDSWAGNKEYESPYGGGGGSSGGNGGNRGEGSQGRPGSGGGYQRYPTTTRKPGSQSGSGSSGGNLGWTSGQGQGRPAFNRRDSLNSPFVGWPYPTCREREFQFRLRNISEVWATQLNGRHPDNGSYGVIGKHCTVRWNLSDQVPYETVVTEGKWYCRAEAYTTIATAVFFLGAIVGGFLIGWIADTFGRVPALVIANILGALGGALSAVSSDIYVFCVFRFITGMAFDNCFTMMYILVLEFCGPSYRTLVANLSIAIFYTLGTLLIPVLAWYISNWKTYALVISLPMLLALLALFFVPESARWLLSKGRAKEATNILRSFAKVNRKKVEEHVFVDFEQEATKLFAELEQEAEEEPSLGAAFKTPRLRRTFIILILFWSLIALVYDGHSRNIINLANAELNVFWMFGIASMTELPADLFLIFTLDKFGRRWLAFGSMSLSGVFSIIAAAITSEMRIPFLITAIISRFWVNVAFNIGLQYAAELLPTVIRAQGVNAIHIMGYVASIISPFVQAIGRTNPALSLVLLGAFSLAAGFLSLFLAETLGEELPNSLEEAEAFGKNQSFWNCPICAKEVEEEWPISPPPAALDRPVMLRNALRGSIRGETYRSSIISNVSGGGNRRSRYIQMDHGVHSAPEPSEATRLRRVTH